MSKEVPITKLKPFLISDKEGRIAIIADKDHNAAMQQAKSELSDAFDLDLESVKCVTFTSTTAKFGLKTAFEHIADLTCHQPQRIVDLRM